MRIISLVPSLTEYLWALGLEQEVVGITKFCIHPEQWWKTKTRVGGTKQLHFDTIQQLQPTLIIANKEENTKEDVEFLQSKYEVLLTDIIHLDDAFFYLLEIGERVNRVEAARSLVEQIKKDLPKDFKLDVALDQTIFIKKSVSEVAETLLLSLVLVILIIYLFFCSIFGS